MIREVAGHIGNRLPASWHLAQSGWPWGPKAAGTKTVAVFGIEIPLVANRLTRFHQDAHAGASSMIEKLHA